MVPLLRNDSPGDLRLAKRSYSEDGALVKLPDDSAYYSFLPHALIANWSNDGSPAVSFGTQLKKHKAAKTNDGKVYDLGFMMARIMSKMRSREAKSQLRFLPLHIAMEGFLALNFRGPIIAWEEYSRITMSDGLGTRWESGIPARWIRGLEDALRVFEIHTNQVGVLIYVADALASVFAVPHPGDYLQLHKTILSDMFGELIYTYGFFASESTFAPGPINADIVNSLGDLRGELDRIRRDWADMHSLMTTNLFGCPIVAEQVYKMGPFSMQRFTTDLDPKTENHIGEYICRSDGSLEYIKSFRLSAAQTKRAYLLKQLSECEWELDACAEKIACTKNQLVYRFEKRALGTCYISTCSTRHVHREEKDSL